MWCDYVLLLVSFGSGILSWYKPFFGVGGLYETGVVTAVLFSRTGTWVGQLRLDGTM
jgi:hypothetical protein